MESNNNNITPADQAKKEIEDAIKNENFSAIDRIINTNPHPGSIYTILDILFEKLQSPSTVKSSEFCFNILERFVNKYGIPIVLWINNPAIAAVFEELLQKVSTKIFVGDLLRSCISAFSFDQDQSHIPNLVELFRKTNQKPPSPMRKQSSPFSVLYSKKQKVIGDSEKLTELSPERKKELPKKIEELLSATENFVNPKFNFLEKDLAIYYYNELVRLLDIFESAEEEWEIVESEPQVVPESENPNLYPQELRFRTSFFVYEKLEEDESITTEYKKYSWEFNDMIDTVLSKTICGFLNRYGGRIYIGVDDNSSVVGIELTSKQRDEAKRRILELMRNFEPSSINTSHLLDIVYLPIKNPVNKQKIPGLFVMKIIVKQGDLSKLYSASRDRCQFYQRNDAQTVELKPGQVVDVLTERLLKPQKKKDESEFIDPKPETLVDLANEAKPVIKNDHLKKPFALKEQELSASGFLKKATDVAVREQFTAVQIRGLPKGVLWTEAEKYLRLESFQKDVANKRIFHDKGVTNSGEAILNFKNQIAAEDYLAYLADSSPGKKHGISGFIKKP